MSGQPIEIGHTQIPRFFQLLGITASPEKIAASGGLPSNTPFSHPSIQYVSSTLHTPLLLFDFLTFHNFSFFFFFTCGCMRRAYRNGLYVSRSV